MSEAAREDGGPAFARPSTFDIQGYGEEGSEGLSLRDYFAAQALAGMCSTRDEAGTLIAHGYEWLAREAFQIADAMLAERTRKGHGKRVFIGKTGS